jgi:hypothetical protein
LGVISGFERMAEHHCLVLLSPPPNIIASFYPPHFCPPPRNCFRLTMTSLWRATRKTRTWCQRAGAPRNTSSRTGFSPSAPSQTQRLRCCRSCPSIHLCLPPPEDAAWCCAFYLAQRGTRNSSIPLLLAYFTASLLAVFRELNLVSRLTLSCRLTPQDILEGAIMKACAVVGSSGALLNTSLGGAIDTHDFVLRINQVMPS